MRPRASLVGRVAWGASLSAFVAALVAALATSGFAALLLERAEDRRLREASVIFAEELGAEPADLDAVVRDEQGETAHTGLLFAVFAADGRRLAGDPSVALPASDSCERTERSSQRACRTVANSGVIAVAASVYALPTSAFALAALAAATLAAVIAWAASRPISRRAVAPLSRLRARIAELDVDSLEAADVGPPEHVAEVDALRETIGQLVVRVERSLEQAQRFAANAAHELRTPLTSVRAELELLGETDAPPAMRADIARAQQKLAELGTLVERLLVLSVPKLAPQEAHEVVSLHDVIEDTVAALPTVNQGRVRLTDQDALVTGDSMLLSMMVANGLGNALKFGTHVRVAFVLTADSVLVEIDDDGPGVEVAERERVFEPFFRSATVVRDRLPGHGLGLALIRHIARVHGGDASFVDKAGPGARLAITLPRRA